MRKKVRIKIEGILQISKYLSGTDSTKHCSRRLLAWETTGNCLKESPMKCQSSANSRKSSLNIFMIAWIFHKRKSPLKKHITSKLLKKESITVHSPLIRDSKDLGFFTTSIITSIEEGLNMVWDKTKGYWLGQMAVNMMECG